MSNVGSFVTYRAVYDRLRYEGFIAGSGEDGFRANVRSAIKRIRNKFRACDPAFDEIENYTGFGYCWRKPDSVGPWRGICLGSCHCHRLDLNGKHMESREDCCVKKA